MFLNCVLNFQAMLLQLTTAVGAVCGTYVSLLAEGMGKELDIQRVFMVSRGP